MKEFLYKYRPFDLNDVWTTEILTNHQIYFSTPLAFNDPFDCVTDLSLDGTDEEWILYIFNIVSKFRRDLSPYEQRLEAMRLFQSGYKANISKADTTTRIASELAVLCLSAVNDDILMWSHYAKNHTGIVLEFKAGLKDYFFRIAQQVIYQEEYPAVRIVDMDDNARMEASILTKSSHWSYEKEYRIIDIHGGPGIRKFPEQLLSGVIMGCRMQESEKTKVKQLVRNHPAKPQLYQAKKAERSFRLIIEEVL